MDGQHRLTAIYRYVKDKFALTDLELLKEDEEFKNKKFSQLSREMKIKILGSHLSVLEFEEFENDNIEIELFKGIIEILSRLKNMKCQWLRFIQIRVYILLISLINVWKRQRKKRMDSKQES